MIRRREEERIREDEERKRKFNNRRRREDESTEQPTWRRGYVSLAAPIFFTTAFSILWGAWSFLVFFFWSLWFFIFMCKRHVFFFMAWVITFPIIAACTIWMRHECQCKWIHVTCLSASEEPHLEAAALFVRHFLFVVWALLLHKILYVVQQWLATYLSDIESYETCNAVVLWHAKVVLGCIRAAAACCLAKCSSLTCTPFIVSCWALLLHAHCISRAVI